MDDFTFEQQIRPQVAGKVALSTEFLRDPKLTPGAGAAIALILSLPSHEPLSVGYIKEVGGISKFKWPGIRDEAIEARYCQSVKDGYWFTDIPGVRTNYSRFVRVTGGSKREIPLALRWEVWERDDFRCARCGTRRFLSVDHKTPEGLGGTLALDNLQTLCRVCNGRKGGRA